MELEQLAVDLDWDDDLDATLLDDDFDAEANKQKGAGIKPVA
jgi:hypothetical protein